MDLPFQVLVTDADSKHSIALQRYLKRDLPELRILGHATGSGRYGRLQGRIDELIGGELFKVLDEARFDMVIPVGATAVRTVAETCPSKAVLPSKEALTVTFDKLGTMRLAEEHSIPHPESWLVTEKGQEEGLPDCFPCVVKPANETEAKQVYYAGSIRERNNAILHCLTDLLPERSSGVLVQELVSGVGRGFFAVYDSGRPVSVFMHERIREYPPSGGASTAAKAIYDPVLLDYGMRLLSTLEWRGPVMVEFKYDAGTNQYSLIEINPKFWGSLELGLMAGVNFGRDLVKVFLGQGSSLQYSEHYDRSARFYWPLDNDLQCIIETRQFRRIADYFSHGASTNLLQSFRVDLLKSGLFLRSLMTRR